MSELKDSVVLEEQVTAVETSADPEDDIVQAISEEQVEAADESVEAAEASTNVHVRSFFDNIGSDLRNTDTHLRMTIPVIDGEKLYDTSEQMTESDNADIEGHGTDLNEFVPNPIAVAPNDVKLSEVDFTKHIPSPNQTAKDEDEKEIEITVDLSQVVFTEENIPEITHEDIRRIRESGFSVTNDFDLQIKNAIEEIHRCREELSDEYQNKIETESLESIKEIKEELETIEDDEDRRSKLSLLEYEEAIIENLAKNNPKQKEILEESEKRAIELVASYQLVSRKDIGDLIENGSIITLVSQNSVNSLLNVYYENFTRFHKIEDSEEKKRLLGEQEKLSNEYFKIGGALQIQEEYNEPVEDKEGNKGPSKYAAMTDDEKIKFNEFFKQQFGYDFIGTEQFLKDEETKLDKQYRELSALILKETNIGPWKKEREELQRVGLPVTVLRLAKLQDNGDLSLFQNRKLFNKRYVNGINDFIFNLIDSLNKEKFEEGFNFIKSNINNITIFPNNLIHYVSLLVSGESIPEEWEKNFDETGQIAEVFNTHSEELKDLYSKYLESESKFKDFLLNNAFFQNTLDTLAFDLFNENEQIKNQTSKKSIKKYFKRHLKSAFNYQLITGGRNLFIELEKSEEERDLTNLDGFISTILHMAIGCKMAKVFAELSNYMKYTLESNLYKFCTEHIFHEFVLEQWALKITDVDQTAYDLVKNKTKEIVHKSADLFFLKNMDVNYSRYCMMKEILIWASEIFNDIIEETNNEFENLKQKHEKITQGKEKEIKKKLSPSREEQLVALKKAKKEAKKKKSFAAVEIAFKSAFKDLLDGPNKSNNVDRILIDPKDGRPYFEDIINTEDGNELLRSKIFDIKGDSVSILVNRYRELSENDLSKISINNYSNASVEFLRKEFDNLISETFVPNESIYVNVNNRIYFDTLIEEYNKQIGAYGQGAHPIIYAAFLFQRRLNTISSIIEKRLDPDGKNQKKVVYKNNARVILKYLHNEKTSYFTKGLICNPFITSLDKWWLSSIITFKFDMSIIK